MFSSFPIDIVVLIEKDSWDLKISICGYSSNKFLIVEITISLFLFNVFRMVNLSFKIFSGIEK